LLAQNELKTLSFSLSVLSLSPVHFSHFLSTILYAFNMLAKVAFALLSVASSVLAHGNLQEIVVENPPATYSTLLNIPLHEQILIVNT
jgi:hypothetical protein